MPSNAETKKQKLTLSVDASAVEKAKNLGLNISGITEAVLRGFTFEPKEGEGEALYQKYSELFDVMMPLLQKYDIWVDVAEETHEDGKGGYDFVQSIKLGPEGAFYADIFETEFKDIKKIRLYEFHPPSQILTNLLNAMASTTERNKQRMAEIELARRIVEAINSTMQPKGMTFSRKPKKYRRQVSESG